MYSFTQRSKQKRRRGNEHRQFQRGIFRTNNQGGAVTQLGPRAANRQCLVTSVFTREDISILPVLETKFEGREFDYLGQLIVTPTMVAMKIRDMKDNKSLGVDGIPPK